jgi:CheY-like chemotaxis protein
MAGEDILVVDDNAANTKLVSFLLTKHGYAVRTAGTADEALAEVEKRLPALILMDIQLPGTDGLTLARRLKADRSTRGAVIIAFTAYAMKGDEAKALDAGCDAYITKPIDTRTLPAQVAGHLERSRSRTDGELA